MKRFFVAFIIQIEKIVFFHRHPQEIAPKDPAVQIWIGGQCITIVDVTEYTMPWVTSSNRAKESDIEHNLPLRFVFATRISMKLTTTALLYVLKSVVSTRISRQVFVPNIINIRYNLTRK